MSLTDIDDVLELCKKHLEETRAGGTQIEAFLVEFLLVRICNEYEKEIARIVRRRTEKSSDTKIVSFVISRLEAYRHLKISDIRGNIIAKFSESYLTEFNKKLGKTDIEYQYTSIVDNRNASAHGTSGLLTLNELITQHNSAKDLFPILEQALTS